MIWSWWRADPDETYRSLDWRSLNQRAQSQELPTLPLSCHGGRVDIINCTRPAPLLHSAPSITCTIPDSRLWLNPFFFFYLTWLGRDTCLLHSSSNAFPVPVEGLSHNHHWFKWMDRVFLSLIWCINVPWLWWFCYWWYSEYWTIIRLKQVVKW